MSNTKFSENVELIKEKIYNTEINDLEINGLLWSYLLVSSSLSTFMPKLKTSDHYKLVQNMQFHRSLSDIDMFYPSLLENTKFYDKSNVVEQSLSKAHIYVSYHAGSYYMILRNLAHKAVPFCVVAGNNYINDYEHLVQQVYKNVPNGDGKALEILSAEDPKLLLKLTKKLADGISVFFFIDGNTGTKENNYSNDKNLLKINFLNHHIYARQGVAFLAYLSKAPVATVIAKRDKNLNNKVEINLLNTDDILAKNDRNGFIHEVTRKLYGVLENYLIKDYEQWSGWFYLHKLFDTEELSEETSINLATINYKNTKFIVSDYVQLVKHDENHIFLVLKKKYEIMRIGELLYDVLNYFQTPRTISKNEPLIIENEVVGFEFLEELIEMNFIKPILCL
ncbi:MAG: hypothetical protein JNJ52_06010 [Flavobacterium sp.]|nr:hypothetical protein [Flavobacterium sp.]